MKLLFSIILICSFHQAVYAQATLPQITVTNMNGRILVSWLNDYKEPIATISIQRSYDSLKHYTTIGSVLNPQNLENGYTDANPPYTKMYYRVFVAFESGKYIITKPARPVKIAPPPVTGDTVQIQTVPEPTVDTVVIRPGVVTPVVPAKPAITYPSNRIFTAKDQNVVINLPSTSTKGYVVKFFDDKGKEVFRLNNLPEDYLIIEKVNFIHSGWFHFELYENGELIEKNKFYISKDIKKSPGNRGNR